MPAKAKSMVRPQRGSMFKAYSKKKVANAKKKIARDIPCMSLVP